jgi:hypothetical protein
MQPINTNEQANTIITTKPLEIVKKNGYTRRNKLTGCNDLQEEFARLVAYCGTLTEAYTKVYYLGKGKDPKNTRPETIHTRAWLLSRKPHVEARIQYWEERKREERDAHIEQIQANTMKDALTASMSDQKIRSFIRESLFTIASTQTERTTDRLKSMELLGKLAGVAAFEKVAQNEKDQDETQAKQKLKELITHLRDSGKLDVIEDRKPKELTLTSQVIDIKG